MIAAPSARPTGEDVFRPNGKPLESGRNVQIAPSFRAQHIRRGFFKEALTALIELGDIKSVSKWAIKGTVDTFLFVNPRRCYYASKDGQTIKEPSGVLQRPLRATTLQGDRIALARSEMLPEGTTLGFSVTLLTGDNPKSKKMLTIENIEAALEYGQFKGFSQWRGGGFGRLTWAKE